MKLACPRPGKADILAAAWTVSALAYSIVYPFIPIYLHTERKMPMEQVGLIFPLMGLGIVISPPLNGYLADRFGRRAMMRWGQLLRGGLFVGMALMAVMHAPFWAFAAVLTLNAAAGNVFQIAADAYLVDVTRPDERASAYGKIRIGNNIGWAVGPMLGAFLARTPFWLMFATTAAMCVGGALFTDRFCPEAPHRAPEPAAAEQKSADGKTPFGWRRILKHGELMKLFGSGFLLYLLTSQLYSVFSIYATGAVGLGRNVLGMIYSLNGFAVILLQMPVTKWFDHAAVPQARRLVLGTALYAAGYFALSFTPGAWSIAAAVLVLTLGEIAVQPALYALTSFFAPAGAVGRVMAVLGVVRGVGVAAGPWIGSVLFARYPGQPLMLWGILSLFAVAAGAGFLMLRPDRRRG